MEFWGFWLFSFLVNLGIACLFGILFWLSSAKIIDLGVAKGGGIVLQAVSVTFTLGTMIPWIAVSVRRLHDIGRSGFWLVPAAFFGLSLPSCAGRLPVVFLLLLLIAAFYAITLFVFNCLNGNKGPNEYGEDPKEA